MVVACRSGLLIFVCLGCTSPPLLNSRLAGWLNKVELWFSKESHHFSIRSWKEPKIRRKGTHSLRTGGWWGGYMGKKRELHTTHCTIHKFQSGEKKTCFVSVCGRVGNPKKSGRNRRGGKMLGRRRRRWRRVFPAHTHVMMTNSVAVVGGVGGSVDATPPPPKKKPQDLMTENSCSPFFIFVLWPSDDFLSFSLGLCKTSAMTHVNSITKLHNPVPEDRCRK